MPTYQHDAYVMSGETVLQTWNGPGARSNAINYMLTQAPPYVDMVAIIKDDNGNWCSLVGPRPKNPPY